MNISEKIPYDKISDIPNYQRWIAIIAVLLLIFSGFYFFFYKGNAKEIEKLAEKINTIEKELNENRLRRKKLPEIKKKVDQLNFKLLIARTQLPGNKEIPELLSQISSLGKTSGLEFLLFRPQAEAVKDFYTEVPVQMKVKGTFHDVVNFYDKLGNFTRIVNISDINIGQPQKKETKTFIQVSSNATTFRYTGNKDDKKETTKSYLNNKLGFSITYKKDWQVEEKIAAKEVIFTDVSQKKKFKGNILVKLIKSQVSMESQVNSDKRDLQIFKNDYQLIKEDNPVIGKFLTHRMIYSYQDKSGQKFQENTTYIFNKSENRLFKVIAKSLKEDYKKYKSLFNDALYSFWIHSDQDFKSIGEEKFWSIPESRYTAAGKRDPFYSLLVTEEMVPIFIPEKEDEGRIKTPLELSDTMSLKLIGIIWDQNNNNTAMIETSDGKGYVVKPSARIGKKNGYVKKITKDSVIIEEKQKYRVGKLIKTQKETIVLKIRTDEK